MIAYANCSKQVREDEKIDDDNLVNERHQQSV